MIDGVNRKPLLLVDPLGEALLADRLFDASEMRLRPFWVLREWMGARGIEVATVDRRDPAEAAAILVMEARGRAWTRKMEKRGLREKCVLMLLESPIVWPENADRKVQAWFPRIMTWNDDLVDGRKYLGYRIPQTRIARRPDPVPFAERKLAVLVNANKWGTPASLPLRWFYRRTGIHPYAGKIRGYPHELYSERRRFIEYFERRAPERFDLYGGWWNRPVSILEYFFGYPAYKTLRKPISAEEKLQALAGYRFCVCYENMTGVKGYLTEKLFETLQAGCVPIYWGASNVEALLPPGIYVDKRKYPAMEDLYDYLAGVEEPEFERYLAAIRQFLDGPASAPFFEEAFARRVCEVIFPDRLGQGD